MDQTKENSLLPIAYVARQLRVPSKWLRQQADEGKIPHVKAGDQYLVLLNSTREFLKSQIQGGTPNPADRGADYVWR